MKKILLGLFLFSQTLSFGFDRITNIGATFTVSKSHPVLGEAYQAPNGVVWGDLVKAKGGKQQFMTQKDAINYCKSIGAELPSREDYIELSRFLGRGSLEGYSLFARTGGVTVLPNSAIFTKMDGGYSSNPLWSASVYPGNSELGYTFEPKRGEMGFYHAGEKVEFRCITRTPGRYSTAKTGDVFTRDTSIAALGEAYRAPNDVVWGDIVKDKGKIASMNFKDALDYCKKIGARLPTTDDLMKLTKYLGRESKDGYNPLDTIGVSVLPNLTYIENATTYGRLYWAESDVRPADPRAAFIFDGAKGDIISVGHGNDISLSVRCVM